MQKLYKPMELIKCREFDLNTMDQQYHTCADVSLDQRALLVTFYNCAIMWFTLVEPRETKHRHQGGNGRLFVPPRPGCTIRTKTKPPSVPVASNSDFLVDLGMKSPED